jgi:hypothetical protein
MEIEQKWCLQSILLDSINDEAGHDSIFIAEVTNQDRMDEWDEEYSWAKFDRVSPNDISGSPRAAIQKLLQTGAMGHGPFSRLGWTAELMNWAETESSPNHSRFSGHLQQLNGGDDGTLIQISRINAAPYWFKASNDIGRAELRFTRLLSQRFPDYVPRLIATHEDWNGWLMEDAGTSLDQLGAVHSTHLYRLGRALANLQISSIDQVDELIDAGFPDLRIPSLREGIIQLTPAIEHAIQAQRFESAPHLTMNRVHEVLEVFYEACCALEDLPVPDTLIHNDINPGNLLFGEGQWVFTDWEFAAVSNPFVTMEHLTAQLNQDGGTREWIGRLLKAYRRRWRTMILDEHIQSVRPLIPIIAIAMHLCCRKERLISEQSENPAASSFIRSLLRQMDQAAQSCADRRSFTA